MKPVTDPPEQRFRDGQLPRRFLSLPFPARLTIVALILVVLGGIGWWAYRNTFGIWDRLEATADRLGTPEGLERLYQVREGGVICFVTCGAGEAMIVVVYQTELSREEACARVRSRIHSRIAPTKDDPRELEGSPDCEFVAYVPAVGSDARMGANYLPAEAFRQCRGRRIDWPVSPCLVGPWGNPDASIPIPSLPDGHAVVVSGINSGIE